MLPYSIVAVYRLDIELTTCLRDNILPFHRNPARDNYLFLVKGTSFGRSLFETDISFSILSIETSLARCTLYIKWVCTIWSIFLSFPFGNRYLNRKRVGMVVIPSSMLFDVEITRMKFFDAFYLRGSCTLSFEWFLQGTRDKLINSNEMFQLWNVWILTSQYF